MSRRVRCNNTLSQNTNAAASAVAYRLVSERYSGPILSFPPSARYPSIRYPILSQEASNAHIFPLGLSLVVPKKLRANFCFGDSGAMSVIAAVHHLTRLVPLTDKMRSREVRFDRRLETLNYPYRLSVGWRLLMTVVTDAIKISQIDVFSNATIESFDLTAVSNFDQNGRFSHGQAQTRYRMILAEIKKKLAKSISDNAYYRVPKSLLQRNALQIKKKRILSWLEEEDEENVFGGEDDEDEDAVYLDERSEHNTDSDLDSDDDVPLINMALQNFYVVKKRDRSGNYQTICKWKKAPYPQSVRPRRQNIVTEQSDPQDAARERNYERQRDCEETNIIELKALIGIM
ncbi:hypothetical protein EVAR_43736_1 [Eumeta japonica]|uniref:Uncharacterized protein n=1 Tax=Eumeta variegata TaxID=151549 RepID=A0A4C1Y0T3_EUMVA|nr:hypothetical protein EVAR_43736_1 [Eumeta japonica]